MKILVTGGAGFIGQNLCRKLLEQGNIVVCMDNFYSSSETSVRELKKEFPDTFSYTIADVRIPYEFNGDEIYNLACPASPPSYQKDPIYTFETSIKGITNALNVATAHKIKVLQTSTSEVYGDAQVHPQSESYWGNVNPDGIRSCYDEGKRGAETLCFDYNRKYGTKIKVVRIFNTYGPGMDPNDGRVVSNFIMQALNDKLMTIYGDGKQTRSFCYVDDLVNGLIAMMESDDSLLGPINLGNPGEFTVMELAQKIAQKLNRDSAIEMKDLPSDDPRMRQPSIERANKFLFWQPSVSLDEGLDKTIEYFKKFIK